MKAEQIGVRRKADAETDRLAGTFVGRAGFRHNKVPPDAQLRWLAVVPFLALIVGPFFVNRASRSSSACRSCWPGSWRGSC